MGMTEYEVADLAASVMANFLTSLTVFLSIVSAYVISAFVAGERLSKVQLSIVNLCFLVSAGILGFIVVSLFRRFFGLAQAINVERGTIGSIDFTWPIGGLLAAIVFGSLVFMWNSRNKDAE
jgi:predicted anti-sigma-YlaC factor YlaD